MDFDTVVVLRDPMDQLKYDEVSRIFESICDFRHDNVSVSYLIADGPVKPLITKSLNIFFHVLLHTETTYRDSPLTLVKASWQYESHAILGAELVDIQRIPVVSLSEVIGGKLGIDHCRNLVETESSAYLKWIATQNTNVLSMHLSPVKFSEAAELLELCHYSVLRGASNSLRHLFGHSWDIGIDDKDMLMFEEVFESFPYNSRPLEMLQEKRKLRSGAWYPSARDVGLCVEQALEFLAALRADLPQRPKLPSPYHREDRGI